MKHNPDASVHTHESFGSRFGMLMTLIGGSVGLGNVWKFPYMTGANGGAAFLLIYLGVILVFGIPMIMLELSIGKKTKVPIVPALKQLSPGRKSWSLVGYFGFAICCIVYAEYATVSGWSLAYAIKAVTGEFMGQDVGSIAGSFIAFIGNAPLSIAFMVAILILSAVIVYFGIQKGLERVSKFLMPLLIVCLAFLAVRAITLPNAMDGIKFYLIPDFSKVTPSTFLAAFGQAFFSLGIGVGATATLGSYNPDQSDLLSDTCWIACGDTLVALLAGFVVFPCLFSCGLSPEQGPALVFITLNAVFAQMSGGHIFAIVFYLLLLLAIFTSTITILQCLVAHFADAVGMSKKASIGIASAIGLVIGVPYALGFGPLGGIQIMGKALTDLYDLILNIGTPLGGMLLCIFVGWVWGTDNCADVIGLKNSGARKLLKFLIKYFAPIVILAVLVSGI